MKMSDTELVTEELMQLYEDSPDLILYKSDLLQIERERSIREIAAIAGDKKLNPIDVVLESLVNKLSERLSIENLTQSNTIAYLDKSILDLAVHRIVILVKRDASFLEKIHKEWLKKLQAFLLELKERGVQTLEDATFQVSLKFRISATSSLRAIISVTQT